MFAKSSSFSSAGLIMDSLEIFRFMCRLRRRVFLVDSAKDSLLSDDRLEDYNYALLNLILRDGWSFIIKRSASFLRFRDDVEAEHEIRCYFIGLISSDVKEHNDYLSIIGISAFI